MIKVFHMSMRLFSYIFMCLIVSSCASPGRNFDARLAFEVTGHEGRPVEDAEVEATLMYWSMDPYGRVPMELRGRTNERGRALLEGETYGSVRYTISHPQYYSTEGGMGFRSDLLRRQVELKPVRDPIPMIAVRRISLPIPAEGVPLEFDMLRADWLPPHGEGEQADVQFRVESRYRSEESFRAYLQARFTGEHDGIFPMDTQPRFDRSVLRSRYEAPPGGYERMQEFEDVEGMQANLEGTQPDGWYFRIRSRERDDGEIGGMYGKIYGSMIEMGEGGPRLVMDYLYIQPEFNNRNVEFDRRSNRAREFVSRRWHASRHLNVDRP